MFFKGSGAMISKYREHLVLGLLIVLLTISNIAWIRHDTRPQPVIDPYPRKTLQFVDGIGEQAGNHIWQLVTEMSLRGRPPLYQLFSVPFILLLGRSMDAALSVNILFQAVLVMSVYGIGKLVKNGKAGLIAALLVATYPPIVNLSRIFRPQSVLACCVALSMWLLLLLLERRSIKIALHFGVSLGLGLLIHPHFVYLICVPTVILGLYGLFFQTSPHYPSSLLAIPGWLLAKARDPFVLFGLLPAALIPVALAAPWYLTQGDALLQVQERVAAQNTIVTRGFDNLSPSFWWYALSLPGTITYVLSFFLAIGLIAGVVRRNLFILVLVLTFVAAYLIFSQLNLAWFRFAAVLPVAAVLTATWIVDIRNKVLTTLLILAVAAVAIIGYSVVTWEGPPWAVTTARALGAPLDSSTCSRRMNVAFCPNPPRREDWRASEILEVILNDPDCYPRRCSLTIVSKNENFNASIFRYHLVRDFAGRDDHVEVSELTLWSHVNYHLDWLTTDYLVYIPQWWSDPFSAAVTKFLNSQPVAFDQVHHRVASFELPGGWAASLVKRTGPLTTQELEEVVAVLDIPQKARTPLVQQAATQRVQVVEELLSEGLTAEAFVLTMEILADDFLSPEEKLDLAIYSGGLLAYSGEVTRTFRILQSALIEGAATRAFDSVELSQLLPPECPHKFYDLVGWLESAQEHMEKEDFPQALQDARISLTLLEVLGAKRRPDGSNSAQALERLSVLALAAEYRNCGSELSSMALDDYKRVAEANPEKAGPWQDLAEALHEARRYKDAIAAYTRAIELAPDHIGLRVQLAKVYRDNDQQEEAVDQLERAVALAPDQAWPRRVLADTYRSLGQLDLAIATYQEVLQLAPESAEAHLGLGLAYEAQGMTAAAIHEYQIVIEMAPESGPARRAQQKLDEYEQ